ncbi:MAG: biotin transporter BioY [Acidobacteriaceae bacterium]
MIRQTALAQDRNQLATNSRRVATRCALLIGATALVALSAHISIPLGFTPVPITLQPFAVLLLGLLLAPRESFAVMTVYLLEGAAGMPVFSPHGPGGIAQLVGPTGGYLLAAPFAAALAGLLYRAGKQNAWAALIGAVAGDLVLLTTGALWLEVLTRASFSHLLSVSVVPFLAGDAAKVMIAAVCAQIFHSFSTRSSSKTQQQN